jgi:hypothetical protein
MTHERKADHTPVEAASLHRVAEAYVQRSDPHSRETARACLVGARRIEQLQRERDTYRNIVKGVHGALHDAGNIPVPGLEEPLEEAVRALVRELAEANADRAPLPRSVVIDRLTRQRDAWKDFAEHVENCVECGMTGPENCHEGGQLRAAAEGRQGG